MIAPCIGGAGSEPLVFPLAVVIDSNEQRPWTFSRMRADAKDGRAPLLVPLVRGNLPCGDYSFEGYETRIAVERKSLADLYQTLGRGRHKFVKYHLAPMHAGYDFGAVVVEADWAEVVAAPPEYTKVKPKTIFRTVTTWMVRYNRVGWMFCPGRDFAEKACFRLLEKAWRELKRKP